MHTPRRIWRTHDGQLVLEGDPTAANLAYGMDDEVENRDADRVKALLEPGTKKSPAPRDKAAAKPADK